MPPVDESLVRGAVWLFAALAFALSAGRSVWFWLRHRRRPVAHPRNARERVWHRAFAVTVLALFVVCAARLRAPEVYRYTFPFRNLETRVGFVVALTLILVGFGFGLLAQSQMGASWRIGVPDEPTTLVRHGLYKYVRNPIYTGLLVGIAGLAILLPSVATAAIFAACSIVIRAWVEIEEARQVEIHGEEFRRYCQETGRFFPKLAGR